MQIHSPDIYGDIKLATAPGTAGQVLTSQGVGVQVIWANATSQAKQYLYTDKAAQVIVVGPADVTWNAPAADAVTPGVSLDAGGILINLSANRTYHLTANITPTVAALAYSLSWVTPGNVAVGSLNQPANGLANLAHVHAFAVYRPLVAAQVKVRMTGAVALTLGTVCSIFIEAKD